MAMAKGNKNLMKKAHFNVSLILYLFKKSVSCRGKPEDCLMLATSIVDGVKWLVQVSSRVMILMEFMRGFQMGKNKS